MTEGEAWVVRIEAAHDIGRTSVKYRAEIDGLRTFAVLPVLLSHAGFSWFSGGYVGVDVFFVISGFLITRIILDALEAGNFSTLRFYERRARRILPAAFTVMIATLAVGWVLMSADGYKNLAQSVVATTLFSNNILLTMTSGYWDMESNFKPLLHTWSLGVEEQYYVVIPLILMLVHRFARRHVGMAIAVIGLASFAICIWSIHLTPASSFYRLEARALWAFPRAPTANFYMLDTRAWELATGGVVSTWLRKRRDPDPNSDLLAGLGLAMILAAVIGFPEELPSPSLFTLLPVLGTALILTYCRAGLTHRLLTWQPIVFLGLISYSTYLWHQPLFAFLRIASLTKPEPWQFGLMILPVLLLAWLSWRFIEQPFRDRKRINFQTLVLVLSPIAAALCAFGVFVYLNSGLPQRLPIAPGTPPPGSYRPYNMAVYQFTKDSFSASSRRKLLVVGDSTARDFINMVQENRQFPGYEIIYQEDIIPCDADRFTPVQRRLVRSATLIAVIGSLRVCDWRAVARMDEFRDKVVIVGPRDFGDNLNPVSRIPLDRRVGVRVELSDQIRDLSRRFRASTPPGIYVDVIRHLSADDLTVPIYDEGGRMLSEDRKHVTRPGAIFVGKRIFSDPVWEAVKRTSDARAAAEVSL